MTELATIEEVLAKMNGVVAGDGGRVTLRSYDPGAQVLEVDYAMKVNEDCPTCSISAEMLSIFLKDAMNSHGMPVDDVVVKEMSA